MAETRDLLAPDELVALARRHGVRLALGTLANWRSAGRQHRSELEWRRIGGRVYYSRVSAERFLFGEEA